MSLASSSFPSRPTSAAMAPVPTTVTTSAAAAACHPTVTDEDLGVSVSVAPGIDSPVFQQPPMMGGGAGSMGAPLPRQPAPLEGVEPGAGPTLSGSGYSGRSAEWFGPDGPARKFCFAWLSLLPLVGLLCVCV